MKITVKSKKSKSKNTNKNAVKNTAKKKAASDIFSGSGSDYALQCRDVKKHYGSFYGVNGVNLEIEKGHIVGILGPDRSGKSTLCKMLAGVCKKSYGEISVDGVPIGTKTKELVSFLPEYPYYTDSTRIIDILNMFKFMYTDFDFKKAVGYIESMGLKLNSTFGGISMTSAKIVMVIIVMCRRARLYVLDEPVAHLEPKFKDLVVKIILSNQEDDSAILIFSKTPNEIHKILDDVMFMHRGQIKLSGTAEEIKQEYGKDIASLYKEVFRC